MKILEVHREEEEAWLKIAGKHSAFITAAAHRVDVTPYGTATSRHDDTKKKAWP